ncbi:DUF1446 domain-containing protein [Nocardioidaceae bacterium]|nr:DUF1446 domain-containing protein [Nocardioidaceae bacterium]
MTTPLLVGNCSGFYGDRLSAMREMLEGGPLDVLTGDYLAELTMLILGRDQMKDPSLGYALTVVRQAEDCLGLLLEKQVRLVVNAGGLNPAGLADRLGEVAGGLGLDPLIAHVAGDDLRPRAAELGFDGALTANAYLGGTGIASALARGADVVVTGRVTDASLVVGAGMWAHGWVADGSALDEIAGAMACGHVLECGAHATGGNFSGFLDLTPAQRSAPLGFPLAELHDDGSSVVTKHPGTGGAVTVDTVTAQLVYEVQSARYLGPDATLLLDTVEVTSDGEDRVRLSGIRGDAPPEQLKVSVNEFGGFRNTVEFVLTGLDIEAKADWVRTQVEEALDRTGRRPHRVDWTLARTDHPDADTQEGASARLRCAVADRDDKVVGRAFASAGVELALASYPGFHVTAPPGPASPYGVHRAGFVDRADVVEEVVLHGEPRSERGRATADRRGGLPGGGRGPTTPSAPSSLQGGQAHPRPTTTPGPAAAPDARPSRGSVRVPLGSFVHARSGDKGGDANLGLWVSDDGSPVYSARVDWLLETVTPDWVRDLLPEAAELEVEVHALPNLGGVNVLIHGLLGEGVAASTRFDPQAKALGEWARSRHVDIPTDLLEGPR